jgi:hypothetical protein
MGKIKPPITRTGTDKRRNGFASSPIYAIRKIDGLNAQQNENCTRYSYSYQIIL